MTTKFIENVKDTSPSKTGLKLIENKVDASPSKTGVKFVKNIDSLGNRQVHYSTPTGLLRANSNVSLEKICKKMNGNNHEEALKTQSRMQSEQSERFVSNLSKIIPSLKIHEIKEPKEVIPKKIEYYGSV
jgi:hypothetical protein